MNRWPGPDGAGAMSWNAMVWGRPVPAAWPQIDASRDTPTLSADREQAWTAAARAGHPGAFDRLVELYSARIYTHLFRLVHNREEAEDLTQETFIRAYRFLYQYDGSRSFRNWLYTIATHVGFNALRTRRRRERYEDPTTDAPDAAVAEPGGSSPRKQAARRELRERLLDAMESLPPQASMLVHLFYFEGMSVQESAEIVGMNVSAAKVALHRARKRLREMLVDEL